jgi:hypothetical protein
MEMSTLIRPDIAGINPVILDPRVIADAANRIRVLIQMTGATALTGALGLGVDRTRDVCRGGRFTDEEIRENLAFFCFLS